VQRQPDLIHPLLQRGQHLVRLGFADAVHDRVIHVPLEADVGELPRHPHIERVVQEQIRQDR